MIESFLTSFGELVLLLIHPFSILFFIALGYWNINSYIFKHALCCVFLAIIINCLLKSIFREIPLPNHSGWSFPSGHSHAVAAFLLSLGVYYRNIIVSIAITLLLLSIGFFIIYFDHHYLLDVIAGYIYAIGTLGIYLTLLKTKYHHLYIIGLACLLVSLYLFLNNNIPVHLTATTFGLITFIIGYKLKNYFSITNEKTTSTTIAIFNNLLGISILAILIIIYKFVLSYSNIAITIPTVGAYILTLFWISFLWPLTNDKILTLLKSDTRKVQNAVHLPKNAK